MPTALGATTRESVSTLELLRALNEARAAGQHEAAAEFEHELAERDAGRRPREPVTVAPPRPRRFLPGREPVPSAYALRRQAAMQAEVEAGRLLYPEPIEWRPRTRGDCVDGDRPCPFVACRYNLYLDILKGGDVKLTFPNLEPDEMAESCALDVVDRRGEATLQEVAELMNITRERVRQIEQDGETKLRYRLAQFRDLGTGGASLSPLAQAMEDA
jgi:hypothetical protein